MDESKPGAVPSGPVGAEPRPDWLTRLALALQTPHWDAETWRRLGEDAIADFPELALTAARMGRILALNNNARVQFPDDLLGCCLMPDRWAAAPPNRILAERHFEPPPDPRNLDGHLSIMPWLVSYTRRRYETPARVAAAPDASVIHWVWPYGDRALYVLSRDNALMVADLTFPTDWPFVPFFDPQSGNAVFHFPNLATEDAPRGPRYFQLGGRDNYMHWILDHVALALFDECQEPLHGATLVCPELAPWHESLLRFFGVDNPVLSLRAQADAPVRYRFDSLTVPCGFPVPERFGALQRRYAALHGEPQASGARIYMSRGRLRPKHRVANEDEVAEALTRRGFTVLYPELMPVAEVARACADASLVVTAPGSALVNFLVFAPQNAVLVHMIPSRTHQEMTYFMAVSAMAHLVPFIDRVLPYYGRAVALDNPSERPDVHQFDAPEHYDVAGLMATLDRAEALQTTL